jgi:hypothetical protein
MLFRWVGVSSPGTLQMTRDPRKQRWVARAIAMQVFNQKFDQVTCYDGRKLLASSICVIEIDTRVPFAVFPNSLNLNRTITTTHTITP